LKKILVMGAGQSTAYLIPHLLKQAEENDWFVTVGDVYEEMAVSRVGQHPRGTAA